MGLIGTLFVIGRYAVAIVDFRHYHGVGRSKNSKKLGCLKRPVVQHRPSFWSNRSMQQSELTDYQCADPADYGTDVEDPTRDPELLRQLYVVEERSMSEVAELLDSSSSTIHRRIHEYSIDVDLQRSRSDHKLEAAGGVEELRRLYHDEELSQPKVADQMDVDPVTVSVWVNKYDLTLSWDEIYRRRGDAMRSDTPTLFTSEGYEHIFYTPEYNETCMFRLHRLLAVAEWGFDAVKDMAVHHKNDIPWDNRPKNLELMTPSEHMRYHSNVRCGNKPPSWRSDAE